MLLSGEDKHLDRKIILVYFKLLYSECFDETSGPVFNLLVEQHFSLIIVVRDFLQGRVFEVMMLALASVGSGHFTLPKTEERYVGA